MICDDVCDGGVGCDGVWDDVGICVGGCVVGVFGLNDWDAGVDGGDDGGRRVVVDRVRGCCDVECVVVSVGFEEGV